MEVRDEDFLLINRDDLSYKITAAELKDQFGQVTHTEIKKPEILFPEDGAGIVLSAESDSIIDRNDDVTTLTLASDKGLSQFEILDDVQQDSGHTPTTSRITVPPDTTGYVVDTSDFSYIEESIGPTGPVDVLKAGQSFDTLWDGSPITYMGLNLTANEATYVNTFTIDFGREISLSKLEISGILNNASYVYFTVDDREPWTTGTKAPNLRPTANGAYADITEALRGVYTMRTLKISGVPGQSVSNIRFSSIKIDDELIVDGANVKLPGEVSFEDNTDIINFRKGDIVTDNSGTESGTHLIGSSWPLWTTEKDLKWDEFILNQDQEIPYVAGKYSTFTGKKHITFNVLTFEPTNIYFWVGTSTDVEVFGDVFNEGIQRLVAPTGKGVKVNIYLKAGARQFSIVSKGNLLIYGRGPLGETPNKYALIKDIVDDKLKLDLHSGNWAADDIMVGPDVGPGKGKVSGVTIDGVDGNTENTISFNPVEDGSTSRWIVGHDKYVIGEDKPAPIDPTSLFPVLKSTEFKTYDSVTGLQDFVPLLDHKKSDWQIALYDDLDYSDYINGAFNMNSTKNLVEWPVDKSLQYEQKYRCRVKHKSDDQESPWSDDVVFQTVKAPPAKEAEVGTINLVKNTTGEVRICTFPGDVKAINVTSNRAGMIAVGADGLVYQCPMAKTGQHDNVFIETPNKITDVSECLFTTYNSLAMTNRYLTIFKDGSTGFYRLSDGLDSTVRDDPDNPWPETGTINSIRSFGTQSKNHYAITDNYTRLKVLGGAKNTSTSFWPSAVGVLAYTAIDITNDLGDIYTNYGGTIKAVLSGKATNGFNETQHAILTGSGDIVAYKWGGLEGMPGWTGENGYTQYGDPKHLDGPQYHGGLKFIDIGTWSENEQDIKNMYGILEDGSVWAGAWRPDYGNGNPVTWREVVPSTDPVMEGFTGMALYNNKNKGVAYCIFKDGSGRLSPPETDYAFEKIIQPAGTYLKGTNLIHKIHGGVDGAYSNKMDEFPIIVPHRDFS